MKGVLFIMSNLSVCGIDCDTCKFHEESDCKGCRECEGKIFWGECKLFQCCSDKKKEHCGLCDKFPCDDLKEFASSQSPERIDNLRKLRES